MRNTSRRSNGAASSAPTHGVLRLPVLFLHAAYDRVCETVDSRLAEPMREDCSDLTERVVAAGHWMPQERPDETNAAIANWLTARGFTTT